MKLEILLLLVPVTVFTACGEAQDSQGGDELRFRGRPSSTVSQDSNGVTQVQPIVTSGVNTECEIQMQNAATFQPVKPENAVCPLRSGNQPAGLSSFRDTYDGANANSARCQLRANDYLVWCFGAEGTFPNANIRFVSIFRKVGGIDQA